MVRFVNKSHQLERIRLHRPPVISRFATRKKLYHLSGWKIYVTPIIRTRINDADT